MLQFFVGTKKNMYKNNMYKITFTKTHICTKLLFKLLYKKQQMYKNNSLYNKHVFVQTSCFVQTCFCTHNICLANICCTNNMLYKIFFVQKQCTRLFFCLQGDRPLFFALCAIASPSMFFSNLLLQKLCINA